MIENNEPYYDPTDQSQLRLTYAIIKPKQNRASQIYILGTIDALIAIFDALEDVINGDRHGEGIRETLTRYKKHPAKFAGYDEDEYNFSIDNRIHLRQTVDIKSDPEFLHRYMQMIYMYNTVGRDESLLPEGIDTYLEESKIVINNFQQALTKLSKDIKIQQDQKILKRFI